jgi:hypothetical protein
VEPQRAHTVTLHTINSRPGLHSTRTFEPCTGMGTRLQNRVNKLVDRCAPA